MKKILLLAILVVLSACKDDKKETNTPEVITPEETVIVPEVIYPKLTGVPAQLNYIFENGYEFADDIKVNYIALQSKGDNKYQLIYGLDSTSNLERIETLRVSSNFYAEKPELFQDKLYQDRKVRQVPIACKVSMLDNEPVISQEFTMIPKKHNQVKVYFYSDNGVENNRIITINNIEFPN